MLKKLTAICAVISIFASCKKEASFENPNSVLPGITNNSPGTGGISTATRNKLVRIGTKAGADTITTNYDYNSADKLTLFSQTGIISGRAIRAEVKYIRNAANIITKMVTKNSALAQFNLDSVEAFITYDVANLRYKHAVTSVKYNGVVESDSVVYLYTGNQLTSAIDYYNDGTGYVPSSKQEYAYNGANLSEMRLYTYNDLSNAYDLDETDKYEYDTKTNPTQFIADAPLLSMDLFYSANNIIKRTTIQTGSAPVEVTMALIYTSTNKPATAVSRSGGVVTSTSNYTYQ